MRAGRLRHKVTLQSVGSTYDAYGDLSNSWTTDASVWASISPVSGKEEYVAGELTGVETHSIRLRYRTGITAQNRIIFGSRTFEIVSVKDWNDYKPGRSLEIFCKEVTT